MKNINLNETVKVKLNETGLKIYENRVKELNEILEKNNAKTKFPIYPKRDDKGYVNFQLWDLMSIFGKRIHIGCDAPFIDNMIYIDKEVKND